VNASIAQGGCATVLEVETPPWRDRLRTEDGLLEQLDERAEQARRRRAQALKDGVQEFGSVYALAKHLGLSETAISNAIKKYTAE
jgi:transcriptional regulator of aromatic amino acid metabolism